MQKPLNENYLGGIPNFRFPAAPRKVIFATGQRERCRMPEKRNLQALASDFRRYAAETRLPAYALLMLRTACELEAFAAGQELPTSSQTGRRLAYS